MARPGKLDTKDGKANRDYDNGRSGRDEHDESDQQHGYANDSYHDAACNLVREMDDVSDQLSLPKSLILRRSIVACNG